jgi:hypothetical protein
VNKRLARCALIPALLLGCSSSPQTTVAPAATVAAATPPTSALAPVTTGAATTVAVAPTTTVAITVTSAAPAATTTATPAPSGVTVPPVAPGTVQISVTVGKDDATDRVEKVKRGASIQLAVSNPASDDSFHLHGYDIEQDVKVGAKGIISFIADKAGTFELESHVTNKPLLTLVVA